MKSRRMFLAKTLSLSTVAGVVLSSAALPSKALAAAAVSKSAPDTQTDLMEAFSGESQANRQYLTFAEQADKEGLYQVAKLFRAIGAAETVHAMKHLRNAGKVDNTMANLKTAFEGETYESTQMYPLMRDRASSEGKKDIQEYFNWVGQVEGRHAELYRKAIEAEGRIAETDYYICHNCGYTHEGKFTGKCPVCGEPDTDFFKVG